MSDIADELKKILKAERGKAESAHKVREQDKTAEKAERGKGTNGEKEHYSVGAEFLAVPEIHTGKTRHSEKKDAGAPREKSKKTDFTYDTVAMPEIHIRKK